MPDFKAARTNMVDCQIHTAGVTVPAILKAFDAIPREKFVAANMQGVAYTDESVMAGAGRFLLEPITHARMIQAAAPEPLDSVLDIGCATGYSTSILSSMVRAVAGLEENQELLNRAARLWTILNLHNVTGVAGELVQGCPEYAPFNLIFMNGSVAEIPLRLIDQLSDNGRLITIVRKPGAVLGQVTLVKKTGPKNFSSYVLFESGSPYLPGFEPRASFQF